MSAREWTETGRRRMGETRGHTLYVSDDYVGHYTDLRDGETVADALADYASTYDGGNSEGGVTVSWREYRDGEEVDRGSHTFEPATRLGGGRG